MTAAHAAEPSAVPGCANCGGIAKLQANRARTRIWIGCTVCPANTGWFDGDDAPQRALSAWGRLPPLVPALPPTARSAAPGVAAARGSADGRDALELLARMLVSGGYRVPTEGRSTLPTLSSADIAAAVGLMRDRVAKDTVVAVATRADGAALARLSLPVYRRVARALRDDPMVRLKQDQPADRWRVRLVIHDAVRDLVWPERRAPAGVAAKAARMRKGDYLRVHRLAYSTLLEALDRGRGEFHQKLFSTGGFQGSRFRGNAL
ncbi:MAG: hypothetical protein KKH61_11790 [Gammaproteobacteria bacterium]|nr:hypothetical protein [Gammaproteobacteria bacterium]